MKKTLISMLLLVCLVVGLLPITAFAADTAKVLIAGAQELSVTEGGAPAYLKNKEVDMANKADGTTTFKGWTQEPGDENNWNVKFEWPTGGTPTVTLKDAKFDFYDNATETYAYLPDANGKLVSSANRTTADIDNRGPTEYNLQVGAIMPAEGSNIDLKVVLKGNNTVETGTGFIYSNMNAKENFDEYLAGTFNNRYFKNITIVGEGENKTVVNGGGIGIFTEAGYDLTLENVNLDITNNVHGSNAIPIHVTKGNLTINGGHIKAKNLHNSVMWCQKGGNVTINGDITVEGKLTSTAGVGAICARAGKVIVNGGKIVGTGLNCPIFSALDAVIINGGDLKLTSAYYAIYPQAGAIFEINGGTMEVMAERAFFSAPIVNTKVTGYAGASAENCEVYEDGLKHKPWVFLSDDKSKLPEVEIDTDVPTVSPTVTTPTLTPTAPTIPVTPTTPTTPSTPAGNETKPGNDKEQTGNNTGVKDPTKNEDPNADKENTDSTEKDGGSSAIIWIAVVVVVLGAGAAVAVILMKRKKA